MTFCASAFEPDLAVHEGLPPPDLPSTAALTPQTLAAMPTGTLTVIGAETLFSAEIWSLLRKLLRIDTSWMVTATRPLPVFIWARAGVATANAAAASTNLRIT